MERRARIRAMATVRPFRALRPQPGSAAAVSVGSLRRRLDGGGPRASPPATRSPSSTCRGRDRPARRDRPACRRGLREGRRELREAEALARRSRVETRPSLYVYRLRMGGHEQTGIAGACSLDEYDTDVIRKHERTRRDKEDDRTRHMLDLSGADRPRLPDLPRPRRHRRGRRRRRSASRRSSTSPPPTAWRTRSGASRAPRPAASRSLPRPRRSSTSPTATTAPPAPRGPAATLAGRNADPHRARGRTTSSSPSSSRRRRSGSFPTTAS